MIIDFDGLRKNLAHGYNAMVRKLNGHQTSDMFGKHIEIPPHKIADEILTMRTMIGVLLAIELEHLNIDSIDDLELEKFETQ